QFEYTSNLEAHFKRRVEQILSPLLGRENLRAEVTADVDFTMTEQTQEYFNPDANALRSEQVNEQRSLLSEVQGVPGALSNQPPAAGVAPEVAGGFAGEAGGTPLNSSKRATRNYEVDKTVSHTRLPNNRLRRLSVAVVVNNRQASGEDGQSVVVERTPEQIARIANLVKDAIGFDAKRGDSVQVISESFFVPEQPAPLPEVPMWEESWFWDIVRQGGGWLLALMLILLVFKPVMSRLSRQASVVHTSTEMVGVGPGPGPDAQGNYQAGYQGGAGAGAEMGGLGMDDGSLHLPGPRSYEKTLDAARNMIAEDPKRVAQVVKKWISEDGRH
ncbi:MAG: flagellar M-ring protein FliF C-terminal domain-containing protein, partial [Candidatus Thiodiazotropha sp.]